MHQPLTERWCHIQCLPHPKAVVDYPQLKIEQRCGKERLQSQHKRQRQGVADQQGAKRKGPLFQIVLLVVYGEDSLGDAITAGFVTEAVRGQVLAGNTAKGHPAHHWFVETLGKLYARWSGELSRQIL